MNLSHGILPKYDDELIVSSLSSDVDNREAIKCINSKSYFSLYCDLFFYQDCFLVSTSHAPKSKQHNLSKDGARGLHLVNISHSTCDRGILKNTFNF